MLNGISCLFKIPHPKLTLFIISLISSLTSLAFAEEQKKALTPNLPVCAYIASYSPGYAWQDGIPTEEEDISIATAILNLAHSLNIQVVAEGVETVEQLQYLQSLQCDFVQGYYVSRPLPVKDLEDWLMNNNANFFNTNPVPPIKQTHE